MSTAAKGRESLSLTNSQQIEMMQHVSQQAAGWLVGVTARTLRDHTDIPRDSSGRYDARDVAKWYAGRVEQPELTDDEEERALTIREQLTVEPVAPVVHFLRQLRDRYGDRGIVAFGQLLLRQWEESYQRFPDDFECAEPSALELQRCAAEAVEVLRTSAARARLDIATTCESCGRVRHGRRWIKKEPPGGYVVVKGCCPSCEAKQRRH